jgi:hypothetical protein
MLDVVSSDEVPDRIDIVIRLIFLIILVIRSDSQMDSHNEDRSHPQNYAQFSSDS